MQSQRQNQSIVITSHSADETIRLGEKIGTSLKGGEIIALAGPLGSGKTHLIKGIAAAAGTAACNQVNSPTFVLINEYTGPDAELDIYHIDAYRLESIAEFEALGFDDLCYSRSVVLIEWADKLLAVLQNIDCIWVELTHISQNQRQIHIKNPTIYIRRSLEQ